MRTTENSANFRLKREKTRFSWNNFPCRGPDIAHNILFGKLLYSRIKQDRFELLNRCLTCERLRIVRILGWKREKTWFSWNNFPCRGPDIAHNILFGKLLYSRIKQDRFELLNRCLIREFYSHIPSFLVKTRFCAWTVTPTCFFKIQKFYILLTSYYTCNWNTWSTRVVSGLRTKKAVKKKFMILNIMV